MKTKKVYFLVVDTVTNLLYQIDLPVCPSSFQHWKDANKNKTVLAFCWVTGEEQYLKVSRLDDASLYN